MSTKNLARTAIEGGRTRGNKWERRNSHAEQRAEVRNYLADIKADPEAYDEISLEPLKTVYKGFDDKLGPMYRWLERHVGEEWDKVRSEIVQTFDTRTTAGRHIVYDHLLRSVETEAELAASRRYRYRPEDIYTSYSDHDYYVSNEGILCKLRKIPRTWGEKIPAIDLRQLSNWLNGRVAGKVGKKLFWFVPADKNKKRGGYAHIWKAEWSNHDYYTRKTPGPKFSYLRYKIEYKKDGNGIQVMENGNPIELSRTPEWHSYTPELRQERRLNEKEMVYWNALPKYYQDGILQSAPNAPSLPNEPNPYRFFP